MLLVTGKTQKNNIFINEVVWTDNLVLIQTKEHSVIPHTKIKQN